MSTPWYRRLTDGLSKSRDRLGGQLNVLLRRGPDLDDEFWSDLEDALIGADICTIPFSVMDKLVQHPLTDIGIQRFLKDWGKVRK